MCILMTIPSSSLTQGLWSRLGLRKAYSANEHSAPSCKSFKSCTTHGGLIHRDFGCANVMRRMELGKTIVGYARVSTDGQSLEAQHAALKAAGATRIYSEKISGAVTERKALARAIVALCPGDVLLVTRLDRLARSTRDLLNVLDAVAKAGAGFKSLADAWAYTTTAHGRLMLTVLGGLAEFERELIRARTDEGRKRAQARGVRFGRKLKLTAHQRQEAIARRETGEALIEIGRSYNVSHSTISRLALR
jgi:DNA invertase Pin-like site-specific DNA recombinase